MARRLDILFIARHDDPVVNQLAETFQEIGYRLGIESLVEDAICRVRDDGADVIVLDTETDGLQVEQAIRNFKELNSGVKLIVKTCCNSKSLEQRIRSERVYYYHLDSFGIEELKMAITGALKENVNY